MLMCQLCAPSGRLGLRSLIKGCHSDCLRNGRELPRLTRQTLRIILKSSRDLLSIGLHERSSLRVGLDHGRGPGAIPKSPGPCFAGKQKKTTIVGTPHPRHRTPPCPDVPVVNIPPSGPNPELVLGRFGLKPTAQGIQMCHLDTVHDRSLNWPTTWPEPGARGAGGF